MDKWPDGWQGNALAVLYAVCMLVGGALALFLWNDHPIAMLILLAAQVAGLVVWLVVTQGLGAKYLVYLLLVYAGIGALIVTDTLGKALVAALAITLVYMAVQSIRENSAAIRRNIAIGLAILADRSVPVDPGPSDGTRESERLRDRLVRASKEGEALREREMRDKR